MFRLTDNYIEINTNDNTKLTKLLWEDIDFIQLFTIGNGRTGAVISEIKIKTKDNKYYKISTDSIYKIKSLIDTFNKEYSSKTNIDMRYSAYLNTKETQNFQIIQYISMVLVLFIFLILGTLQISFNASKYYDKNITVKSISTTGNLCPRNYQTINSIKDSDMYIYRYECGFYRKALLIYEEHITKDKIKNLNEHSDFFTQENLLEYWKSK